MARPRLELQTLLESIMSQHVNDKAQHVWFQPPSSVYLAYPCIIYNLAGKDVLHANDKKYRTMNRYTVTVIDHYPFSEIASDVEDLNFCSFDRVFSVDGLYHTTFTLYF